MNVKINPRLLRRQRSLSVDGLLAWSLRQGLYLNLLSPDDLDRVHRVWVCLLAIPDGLSDKALLAAVNDTVDWTIARSALMPLCPDRATGPNGAIG